MQYLEFILPVVEVLAGLAFTFLCAYAKKRLKLSDKEAEAFELLRGNVARSYRDIKIPMMKAHEDGKITEDEKSYLRSVTISATKSMAKGSAKAVIEGWSKERTLYLIEKAVSLAKGKK